MSDEDSKSRSGGVNIGGNAKIGGHVVGQDLTINTGGGAYVGGNVNVSGGGKFVGRDDQSQTGLSAQEVAQLFDSIYRKIDAKADLVAEDRQDLTTDVKAVQAEVAKGEDADEGQLSRSLRNIKRMAPDILEVIVNTFADPALGVATVIRKVMAKAKAS